jgi:GDP-L-fucose synthase
MKEKILITGASGMVGLAFQKMTSRYNFVYVSSPSSTMTGATSCDLRDTVATQNVIAHHRPNAIIHLAAKVGGVKSNMDYLADFYHDNIMINTNLLEAARIHKVDKVVSLLSTCVYPNTVSYPLTEDQIHKGPPHSSNYAYAYAKRMLDIQSQAYRDQYGCNFVTAVPNNLFGENDNFHLENSHVLPAMIRKIYEAKQRGSHVELWGDGKPLREFTYSGDVARALLLVLEGYNGRDPINIGNTEEVSIKGLAEMISEILEFQGEITWNTSKPKGQFKKPSDNSKFQSLCQMNYTPLTEALKKTCDWFIMNYPNVRDF